MRLSAPLRVIWDWNWPPVVHREIVGKGPGAERARVIGEELRRARVLMIEAGYPGIQDLRDGLVASVLGEIPAQVSLVLSAATIAALGDEEAWGAAGGGEVWADATPLGTDEREKTVLPRKPDGSVWPDMRLYLTSANGGRAAETVRLAVEEGCRRLSLPILPLFGSFLTSSAELIPSWRDLVSFADHLEPLLRRFPDLDLRIHNQALWTLLRARGLNAGSTEEAPGHSGCQAASALAYVDPGGTLYPCAALPLPLGRLEEGSMERLWSEEERSRLRSAIETVPPDCGGCRLWETCRGGCRGWAHFISGDWGSPGPDCGRPIDEPGTAP